METQIESLKHANGRLQDQIGEQSQINERLEAQSHLVNVKYDQLIHTKQTMRAAAIQTNKLDWVHNQSSQTQIIVKYDQQQQASLIDEDRDTGNSEEMTEAILNKDREIREIGKQA